MNTHFGSWSFDLRPRKVMNRPNSISCKWRATCCWKDLDEGYNFGLNLIPIGGLHKKLWTRKVAIVATLAISGLSLESPVTKSHSNATPARRCKVYYMGEGHGFPWVWAVVSLVSPRLPMVRPNTKGAPTCASQLVCWFGASLCEWVKLLVHALLPL
jgi:hypothetical protein